MNQKTALKTSAAAMLAGLICATAPAFALEPALPRSPKVFAKLDTDSNGRITIQELEPRALRRFTRLDGDKNGEVSSAEIDASLQKFMTMRRNRMLKAMDADSSGAISRAELDRFVEKLLKAADADADGGVSLDEARNFRLAKLRKPLNGESTN